jgi:hypothetical protein
LKYQTKFRFHRAKGNKAAFNSFKKKFEFFEPYLGKFDASVQVDYIKKTIKVTYIKEEEGLGNENLIFYSPDQFPVLKQLQTRHAPIA